MARVAIMQEEVEKAFEAVTDGRDRFVLVRDLTAAERNEVDSTIPPSSPVGSWALVVLEVRFRDNAGCPRYGRIISPQYCRLDLVKERKVIEGKEYRDGLRQKAGRKAVADDLREWFEENGRRKDYLAIDLVIPYHYFVEYARDSGLDPDEVSMRCNNSYAFAPRMVRNTSLWSRHTYGAIDLNPFYNPALVLTDAGVREGVKVEELGPGAVRAGRIQIEPPTAMIFALNRERMVTPYTVAPGSPTVRFFEERGWTWGGHFVSLRDYQHFGVAE